MLARVNNKTASTSILIEAGTKVNNEFENSQFLHNKMNFTSIITNLSPRIKFISNNSHKIHNCQYRESCVEIVKI